MRILVISDTHLHQYDERKSEYLKKIINKHDRVIINGDFWDGWFTTPIEFVRTYNDGLLKLLKKKKTVYIYGNHDPEPRIAKDLLKIFSVVQTDSYELEIGDTVYHFEHGHEILKYKPISWLVEKYYQLLSLRNRSIYDFLRKIETYAFNRFPEKIMNSKFTKEMNDFIKSKNGTNKFYVTSDTHLAEIDRTRKYANPGFISYGFASYLTINDDGIFLTEERY